MGKNKIRQAIDMRHGHYRRKYAMTTIDYDLMCIIQGNCCACCGRVNNYNRQYFDIDHDHYSGEARGLLCNACNRLVGKAEHLQLLSEKILKKVEKYLAGRVLYDII